jgi:ABC-type transporter MlaC component
MVVKIYSAEFLKYKSGKFKTVQEKKASENHTLVYSTFLVNGNLHKVDWSLFLVDGKWLVFDLKVNGISISQIQKAAIDGKISEIKRAGVKDVLDKFLKDFAIDYGK